MPIIYCNGSRSSDRNAGMHDEDVLRKCTNCSCYRCTRIHLDLYGVLFVMPFAKHIHDGFALFCTKQKINTITTVSRWTPKISVTDSISDQKRNLPFCSRVMVLNNCQKSDSVEHYDVRVKLTFDLLDINAITLSFSPETFVCNFVIISVWILKLWQINVFCEVTVTTKKFIFESEWMFVPNLKKYLHRGQ